MPDLTYDISWAVLDIIQYVAIVDHEAAKRQIVERYQAGVDIEEAQKALL